MAPFTIEIVSFPLPRQLEDSPRRLAMIALSFQEHYNAVSLRCSNIILQLWVTRVVTWGVG